MDNTTRMKLEPLEQGGYPMPSAFNTLDQQSTTADHHPPHQQSRQFLSKKEEERPTYSDTGDGQHAFERNKQQQQQLHSISNNFSVNSKCDPSPFSVSSTSSSVVEQQNKENEVIENPETTVQQHHHHHHHHHYHSHYYNYYSNNK